MASSKTKKDKPLPPEPAPKSSNLVKVGNYTFVKQHVRNFQQDRQFIRVHFVDNNSTLLSFEDEKQAKLSFEFISTQLEQ